MTSFLGYTENLLGAWQLARKAGRMHTNQKFLEQNQTKETNYFDKVSDAFIERLIPYLTGELEEVLPAGAEKKKVRFANNYSQVMIAEIWERFFTTLSQQLTESFESEMKKQNTAASQQALAPHQHMEEAVRKKKKIQERIDNESEMGTGSYAENKPPEELFEDPF
uniref:Uncharacterized protein n=1 Tax=Plectus sambesii TaxID=2011161 RepID=A0A914XFK4_9BILA